MCSLMVLYATISGRKTLLSGAHWRQPQRTLSRAERKLPNLFSTPFLLFYTASGAGVTIHLILVGFSLSGSHWIPTTLDSLDSLAPL